LVFLARLLCSGAWVQDCDELGEGHLLAAGRLPLREFLFWIIKLSTVITDIVITVKKILKSEYLKLLFKN